MLTDLTEAEFDLKEEEPWYDHQDLEHDLHLAAELGKNLLEQNRDLEQTLQQMHETNQEQLQEIEYLSKQVDLLRSVNDQHAKVYEQLDSTSRDLELKNQRLVLENRAAQVKIDGLTETVDGLQTQVEELQRDVKKLKQSRSDPDAPPHDDVQGLTRCKQKCQLNKNFSHERSIPCSLTRAEPDEELLRSTRSLRARLRTERAQREAAEREADALAQELGELEPKAALLGVYERRLAETEAEVEELRLLLRSSKNNLSLLDEEVGVASHRGWSLHSCSGERRRGISLLNEMDAQYVALKEQHDALLRRCEERASNPASQPAYKTLFHELFTFIQKSKEELTENRTKPVQVE